MVWWLPYAAEARQPSGAELSRAIERLGVVGNVLYVAAHPDDENTRLLAYFANERLLRTAYLSLTRGEGGQNLIGSEQAPLLGVIRTEELLAARGVDGAEQLFTRARDFGYSKSPEETLSIWGKDEVLADMVQIIRRYRPDVIVTRFPPGGRDTHGHHTASADLAVLAFRAAADPHYHPEQLTGEVTPWQAKRVVWNKWSGPGESLAADAVKVDAGAYNPVLGLSYGEMAAQSRTMHKSQGFGAAPTRGSLPEQFQLLDGAAMKQSPLDGVDVSWSRVPGSANFVALVKRAREQFRPEAPQAVLPILQQAQAALDAMPASPYKAPKQRELEAVIAGCSGLWTEAFAAERSTTPGGHVAVTALAINRLLPQNAGWRLREVRFSDGTVAQVDKPLGTNTPVTIERTLTVPAETEYSNPYWLAEPPSGGLFTVRDRRLVGMPALPPSLSAEFVIAAGDRSLSITRPVEFKWTDPVAGERRHNVEVLPPVMLNPAAPVLMFPDARAHELKVTLSAGAAKVSGAARVELPAGWHAEPATRPFSLAKGAETVVSFRVTPPAGAATASLRVVADVDGRAYSRGVTRIAYAHIPQQTLTPEANVKLVRFDLARKGSRIGYIVGAGDEVPTALRQVGYEVTLLNEEALAQPLGRFDSIVVGVRAYNTNARLPTHYAQLMRYVADGGTLLVQYNTRNWISKTPAEIGPYPFDISQDRVTDENAAIGLVDPAHPAFHAPNRIGNGDFAGWVQERGLYFADKWDPKYQALLTMNDPGEPARRGGLLVAHHGKGIFIYTGLAFFRQLPAGVPGAYRLFANLLALGK